MLMTYEEVLSITKVNKSFKMKYEKFGSTTVAMCTYFLASSGDFFDAKKDNTMIKATELRGISFVNNNDGNGWKRYLFIEKFFNIGQTNGTDITMMKLKINDKLEECNINQLYSTEDGKIIRALDLKIGLKVGLYNKDETIEDLITIKTIEKEVLETKYPKNSWMLHDIKDLEIEEVSNKEDGSAVRFLIINGELMAKTKFSFESKQCLMAMEIVNKNEKLKNFILDTLNMNIAALFEIVSPLNKVVLIYKDTNLKLLQMRYEDTGDYIDIYNNELVKKYNILKAPKENLEKIKYIAQKYSKKEAINILKEKKFNTLESFLDFLENNIKE